MPVPASGIYYHTEHIQSHHATVISFTVCVFLQDMVVEFARMDACSLLEETEKAVSPPVKRFQFLNVLDYKLHLMLVYLSNCLCLSAVPLMI